MQRKYVWTQKEASRFIDSVLLGLPTPGIFLAKREDEKLLIIDGYQRIMIVYDFLEGKFSDTGDIFVLSNSNIIHKKWKGKTFAELADDEKRKIKNAMIHAVVFMQKHPKDDTGMYQIFERINTAGKILKPQEIRNCVYFGSFNELLIEMNQEQVWRNLIGSKMPDSIMNDIELILRFFTLLNLYNKGFNKKQIILNKELNLCMLDYKKMTSHIRKQLKIKFLKTIKCIEQNIGLNAFKNINKKGLYAKQIHPSIYDAVMIATYEYIKNIKQSKKLDLQEKYKRLLNNDDFIKYISKHTTKSEHIIGRINLAKKYLYGI